MQGQQHPEPTPWLEVTASRGFCDWLASQQISLAVTTYQAGKLLLFGRNSDGQLSVFERSFNRCMGLYGNGQTLWMTSLFQLWRFENVLKSGEWYQQYDCLYVPRVGYTTGDLDVHDIALDKDGQPVFVNSRFSCLARLSDRDSFRPLWKPSFVSELVPEDRCHLNGMALDRGVPKFVTVVSRSNVADGWREHRHDGGCVLDVATGRVVADGLSMPHSPRLYRGTLWLFNSGSGYFGRVDENTAEFVPLKFCPGYLRGLAFAGDYAIVGLSQAHDDKTFSGLPLHENLAAANCEPRCGLMIIDLRSNDIVHWLRIEEVVTELYDVVTLPGVTCPMAFGFKSDEIQRTITIESVTATD